MPKFKAFVPVYLQVTLEAQDREDAELKSLSSVYSIIEGSGPWTYEGASFELVPLDEGEDDTPDVEPAGA